MPLGWYLAQGLIPLVPHSSDDEEGPCELPDGRLVCGPHGLVHCGKCCTDYSFMDDVLDEHGEDSDDDEIYDGERSAGERPAGERPAGEGLLARDLLTREIMRATICLPKVLMKWDLRW